MASFLDTALALNPIFLFRWDELDTSEPMRDSSPNELDGEYFADAVLGLPSPIETDPSSFAAGGRIGRLLVAPASLADVRGNYTRIIWGKYVASADGVLMARNGQLGLGGSNFIAFNSGDIQIRIAIGGNSYVLGHAEANLTPDTYYMIRETRNGTLVKLHVNEVLVDQVTVTGDPIDIGLSDGWYFGRSQSANAHFCSGADEAILCDYAITDVQGLELYESALNSLSLSGYSNVVSSAILYSDIEPDPISFPFRHNWASDWIERISFSTGVSTATKGYESANAQRIKPRREIEFVQVTRDDTERRMLRAKLNAQQSRKWLIPILDDRERLTTPISSGAMTITTDTLYRDYEIGGRVGLRQLDATGAVIASES